MEQARLPEWESELIDQAIEDAERRLTAESERARKRAVQLAREQGYHRLAVAIDRPEAAGVSEGQLSFFPDHSPTLFDSEDD